MDALVLPLARSIAALCLRLVVAVLAFWPAQVASEAGADVGFTLIGRAAGPVHSVVVQGRHAYAGVGHKLLVFDIRVPTRPRLVHESPALPRPVEGLAVDATHVYAAAGKAGLFVYDIALPSAPVLAGAIATPGTALDVAVRGVSVRSAISPT